MLLLNKQLLCRYFKWDGLSADSTEFDGSIGVTPTPVGIIEGIAESLAYSSCLVVFVVSSALDGN